MNSLKNGITKDKQAYIIKSDYGKGYLWKNQLFKVLATHESTGNMFEVLEIIMSKNESFPTHTHKFTYESILVTDGVLKLVIKDEVYFLNRGDYVFIPPNTTHFYESIAHRTKFLNFYVGETMVSLFRIISKPYDYCKPPEYKNISNELDEDIIESNFDIVFKFKDISDKDFKIVRSGEGENFVTGAELHSLVTRNIDTDGRYIVVASEGPVGKPIVRHYHEKHTEIFYCFEGNIKMFIGPEAEEIDLFPGDFLHAPAGTIHSYKMNSIYTKMIGLLVPGLFEPFFRTLGDKYDFNSFPNNSRELNFENVLKNIEELDLKLF